MLSAAERDTLLRLARAAIASALAGEGEVDEAVARAERDHGALRARRATFVTVKHRGVGPQDELRGCIGTLEPAGTIARSVADNAVRAGLHDPRFAPLARDELPGARISVSVLDEPRPIRDAREIILGRDGVILMRGASRAVFLPQVAVEAGWDVPTLLAELARKAGLPRDAWRDAELRVFGTESFGD